MNNNFEIGIITCDRPHYVKNLLKSVSELKSQCFIVNDGTENISHLFTEYRYIQTKQPKSGVGAAKNIALLWMIQNTTSDYFFLLEDDIVIKDQSVFDRYIQASKLSGIQHFNFAFHGDDNYTLDGKPSIKLKIEYSPECAICLYPNVYGAFSFYTRKCIEECGIMDNHYYNALEHVDHTYKIIQKHMHPPFRWFADIANSDSYISEQDKSHSGSTIRKDQSWVQNFHNMADYFAKQNGFDVRDPYAKVATKEVVIESLKNIKALWKK